jgi:isopentenyldiphosphate isomerase
MSLKGKHIGSKEKKEFHDEMRKEYFEKGKTTIKHKDVRLLLLNSKGRIILQRRSKWKGDNAGLWDKTIGGHISSDEGYDLTMVKECSQELGIPATIVKEEEFDNAVRTTDLHILAILRKVMSLDNFQSKRIGPDNREWIEPSISAFYFGYYDGTIQFVDGESCGLQVFAKEEIEEEIKNHPEHFTTDIKYMLEKFADMIKPVKNRRPRVLSD